MTRESLVVRGLQEGTCEVHDWPTEGLAKRLLAEMRRKREQGGVTLCAECVTRAKASVTREGRRTRQGEGPL